MIKTMVKYARLLFSFSSLLFRASLESEVGTARDLKAELDEVKQSKQEQVPALIFIVLTLNTGGGIMHL